jgi:hypothetical protein
MSDGKPDYAGIIASRRAPMPTVDLEKLRQRSAEATKATEVFQSASQPAAGREEPNGSPEPAPTPAAATESAGPPADEASDPEATRVPLRFSIPAKEHHQLRIQAAIENRSVPDLMRAIIAEYLRQHDRLP